MSSNEPVLYAWLNHVHIPHGDEEHEAQDQVDNLFASENTDHIPLFYDMKCPFCRFIDFVNRFGNNATNITPYLNYDTTQSLTGHPFTEFAEKTPQTSIKFTMCSLLR